MFNEPWQGSLGLSCQVEVVAYVAVGLALLKLFFAQDKDGSFGPIAVKQCGINDLALFA